ncbi:hypothetical protein [Candidatus Williamhamiltonella defendens]|uniref:hypothetical protein n=1 Tax=Candidatus Williamhamiltonella defendens TaxID=138072 RepID=UPI001F2C01B6|nr:hypothetical protein [Candidatus Hamiltonella defensa]
MGMGHWDKGTGHYEWKRSTIGKEPAEEFLLLFRIFPDWYTEELTIFFQYPAVVLALILNRLTYW